MKRVLAIIGVLIVLAVGYFSFSGYAILQKQFTWEEMDWDNSGDTSLNEFFRASDIGVREIEKGGNICREFYAYKDGLPVKIICP
mgnify:CR=1 FL=1